jgi:hypothetical protein
MVNLLGKLVEPACWGEGKAIAGQKLVEKHQPEYT